MVCLGISNKGLEIVGRKVRAHYQYLRGVGNQHDWRKVGRCVVKRLLVERLVWAWCPHCRAQTDTRRALLFRRGTHQSFRRRPRHFQLLPAGRGFQRDVVREFVQNIDSTACPKRPIMVTGRVGQSRAAAEPIAALNARLTLTAFKQAFYDGRPQFLIAWRPTMGDCRIDSGDSE